MACFRQRDGEWLAAFYVVLWDRIFEVKYDVKEAASRPTAVKPGRQATWSRKRVGAGWRAWLRVIDTRREER
jgi:hypothetical protein